MASAGIFNQAGRQEWSDEQAVDRVLSGETALYEILMRRYNQRLYRVARAILRDDAEAEAPRSIHRPYLASTESNKPGDDRIFDIALRDVGLCLCVFGLAKRTESRVDTASQQYKKDMPLAPANNAVQCVAAELRLLS
jgi:hypothetical protein